MWIAHEWARLGSDDLRPLLGEGGAYFRLSGMHYDNNTERIAALGRLAPLTSTPSGAAVHPVILIHDPSVVEDATPIGVCGATGYIGSAWNAHASVAKQVPATPRGRYFVTVAALTAEDHGYTGRVWLPTPDTPR